MQCFHCGAGDVSDKRKVFGRMIYNHKLKQDIQLPHFYEFSTCDNQKCLDMHLDLGDCRLLDEYVDFVESMMKEFRNNGLSI